MKRLTLLLLLAALSGTAAADRVDSLLTILRDPANPRVLVVAHRGDWRNAPENSLAAVDRAIRLGVDMVEVDVRLTRDGVPVLMHDATIDRTTNGRGKVADYTLAELRRFRLKDALGTALAAQPVPTLEEVMTLCRDRVLVNVDKAGDYMDRVRPVLISTATARQVVYKGDRPYREVRERYGALLDSILYMPMILAEREDMEAYINDFIALYRPVAFEISYKSVSSPIYACIGKLKQAGCRVWTNSLWPSNNAGHDDERAVLDPDANWGWLVDQGTNIIQTDRPRELLDYLARVGKR
ncbi:MAG: glycerophosphodiester phosphodiesterase family protein [Odoribacteraceae bacterium]|jgi:glycerophosphoryl diester phosphodiesterase|nr:glycerophosphodiester phosphodiesterase family protein [Odoribacteraceae bacterium]